MYMNYFIVLSVLLIVGCSSLEKKKTSLPTVSTSKVIESLNETKLELTQAGESNTKVASNINKALTLAERLEKLLEEIEKQTTSKE